MAGITEVNPESQILRVVRLSDQASLPVRGSSEAAGLDLSSAIETVILPGARACVPTDLQLGIPSGCYGRIAPRSGLALKFGIDVGAGVIDADYRGNVGVLLFNFGESAFCVKPGDRIAQLVLERIHYAEVAEVSEISFTERGESGFGSTGLGSS